MSTTPKQSQRSAKAFTLVELVVVIAVVGILAALLLSALGRVKARTSRIQCVSNLRNIGLAARIFATDNEGLLPTYASDQPFWRTGLHPYLGLPPEPTTSDRIFICPKDREQLMAPYPPLFMAPYSSHWFSSYAYNGFHIGSGVPRQSWDIDTSKNPSRTVLVAEAGARFQFSFHNPENGSPGRSWAAKNPKSVVLFTDGHASYLKTFFDVNAGVPAGYYNADIWSPEPPPEYEYTWNVE